jgi:electron transport complex protein RnfB
LEFYKAITCPSTLRMRHGMTPIKKINAQAIEKCLPQTQCGLCKYPGCKPYAEAILANEASIDHCHPGGEKTLDALSALLGIDPEPYRQTVIGNYQKPLVALIDKDACIGCTKCLPPCPVDAIVGMHKHMHSVIAEVCTGCGLCIEPCPMDCITLVPSPVEKPEPWSDQSAEIQKERFEKHLDRLHERQKNKFAPIRK